MIRRQTGLHSACGARPGEFPPQDRGQREAHQIVQRSSREISFDELHIDLARIFHRIEHGSFRDRVENDAFPEIRLA